jgi:putative salt-induced outer membrane protein YdiY
MKILLLLLLTVSSQVFAEFSNESEAGIAAANGNTKTQTYNAKQMNMLKWDNDHILRFDSRYLSSTANEVETARIFRASLRYERELTHKINVFVGEAYEADRFAGIKSRYITDAGGKYLYVQNDQEKFFTELGYRFQKETRFEGTDVTSSYLRLYNEWEKKWNQNFSTKYWLEILPNLSNSKDYQYNTELSVSSVLSKIFSLKSGILIRHDQLPAPGVKYKTDTLFTTALVAKF